MKATAGVQGWPRGTGRGGLPWKPLLGTQDRPLPWERGPQERVGSPRGLRLSSPFLSGGLWPLLAPTSTVGPTWGPEALSEHVHLAWNVGGRGGRSHTHRGECEAPGASPHPALPAVNARGWGGGSPRGVLCSFLLLGLVPGSASRRGPGGLEGPGRGVGRPLGRPVGVQAGGGKKPQAKAWLCK